MGSCFITIAPDLSAYEKLIHKDCSSLIRIYGKLLNKDCSSLIRMGICFIRIATYLSEYIESWFIRIAPFLSEYMGSCFIGTASHL